ncbi:MAG TPA: HlyD family efflux transporter periplasmic adaptor subunit, partial [Arenimonas sp.]
QAESALAIARRYARADFAAIARNTILDAVQDEQFLGEKTGVLRWRQDQSSQRGEAELNVLGVQRGSLQADVDTKREDLSALELRAAHDGIFMLVQGWSGEPPRVGEQLWASGEFATLPDVETLEVELRAAHDGIFMLVQGWSGEPPRVGEQLWASGEFATLPDVETLEVELRLPQQEAQGLALGQKVELAPLGHPAQQTVGEITWIASAPRAVSRQNPAKFVSAKASVPADAARQYAWVPGQAFTGRIILLQADAAITVPNVALSGNGDRTEVNVLEGGEPTPRPVVVGVRGPSRTQVVEGLAVGDRVLLATADALPDPEAEDGDDTDAEKDGATP